MRILSLDLETSGLLPKEDFILQIGFVLFEAEPWRPLWMEEVKIDNPLVEISPSITSLTHSKEEDYVEFGIPTLKAFNRLAMFCDAHKVDFIAAHNGHSFDKPFLFSSMSRLGAKEALQSLQSIPWLDTMRDLPVPGKKLNYMAADHGFLNPFPHNAISDCLTTAKIMSQYSLKEIIDNAASRRVILEARILYEHKEIAKSEGFYWNPSLKKWLKEVREKDVPGLMIPFSYEIRDKEYYEG